MSATSAGAIKAYIESLGLALPTFRRQAPPEQVLFPYVTVQEAISLVTDLSGDEADPDARVTARELVQVDLWEQRRQSDGSGERYGLPALLLRRLRAARLPIIGTSRVYGVSGLSLTYVPDPDPAIVHHALSLTIRREL